MTRQLRWARIAGAVIVVASIATAVVLLLGGNGHARQPHAGCSRHRNPCRVLFVGNSYTYANDSPAMFESLASAGGHSVETEVVAGGGESLADHVASGDAAESLRSAAWNVVVLQEQSQIPASEHLIQAGMFPAARQLVNSIQAAGAQPMFFLTWAHRDGWPENGLPSYASMQSAVDAGYFQIGRSLHVAVAPVGVAWAATLAGERPAGRRADLWREDGIHPTKIGTYLTACVFYASIFRETPVGLPYNAGISATEVVRLQAAASHAVLGGV